MILSLSLSLFPLLGVWPGEDILNLEDEVV